MRRSLVTRIIHTFIRKTQGAGLLEYALVTGLVALLSIVAVASTGTNVRDIFCIANARIQGQSSTSICATGTIIADGSTDTIIEPDTGGGQGVVEPPVEDGFVFDTTGLFFPNVILPEGTAATQNLSTPFAGTYSTNLAYSVRRLDTSTALDLPTTRTLVQSLGETTATQHAVTPSNQWSASAVFNPNTTSHIGLQMTPPTSPTASLVAYYEVRLRPSNRPSLAQTFSFSVTRAGGDLVFEPALPVRDVNLPVGTTGEQTVMFDLKGAFNTDLIYSIQRNGATGMGVETFPRIRDLTGSLRRGDVGGGRVVGDSVSTTSRIRPNQVTQVGLQLTLPNSPFVEASAQYDLMVASVDTPDDVRTYTFTVNRPAQQLVFEPTIAVEDVTIPAGTTTAQEFLFPFTGAMNADITYAVRRVQSANMANLTTGRRVRTRDGAFYSTNSINGDITTAAFPLSPTEWNQLGLVLTPSADVFQEASATYELLVSSTIDPAQVRTFAFTVTRPAQTLTFEPSLAVEDITLPAGTTTAQDFLFAFSGAMNTDVTYAVQRVGSSNMEPATSGRRQRASDNALYNTGTVQEDNTTAPLTITPAEWNQLGLRIQPGSDIFQAASATYNLLVASVSNPTDVRTFTFTVTRPAEVLTFNPTLAVQNITLAAGTTTAQDIFFDLGGEMNANIGYSVQRTSATNMGATTSVLRRGSTLTVLGSTDGSTQSGTFTVTPSNTSRLGVRITAGGDLFQESRASYTLTIAPLAEPTNTRTFTFTVERPAHVFNPQIAVSNTIMPAGTTGNYNILFDLDGTMTTNFVYAIQRISATRMGATSTAIRYSAGTGTTLTMNSAVNEAYSGFSSAIIPSSVQRLGVRVVADNDIFVASSASYRLILAPANDTSNTRTFTFTLNRPAQALVFTPQLAVQNITLPAGQTTAAPLLFDLTTAQPTNASGYVFRIRRNNATNFNSQTSAIYARSNGSTATATNSSISGNDTSNFITELPLSTTKLGVQITPNNTASATATASYTIQVAPKDQPTNWTNFTFTVTRPGL